MLGLLKRLVAPVAAIALVASIGAASRADTVSFTTTGSFTSAGSDSVTASPGTALNGDPLPAGSLVSANGGLELDFTGATVNPSSTLPTTFTPIGKFALYFDKSATSFDSGDTFTLTINQSSPPGPSQGSGANITGTISYNPGTNYSGGTITLHFNPNPVQITAGSLTYLYLLHDEALTVNVQQPGFVGGTLTADISVAPLPATASMGFGLLGCLGGFGLLRRRRQLA